MMGELGLLRSTWEEVDVYVSVFIDCFFFFFHFSIFLSLFLIVYFFYCGLFDV